MCAACVAQGAAYLVPAYAVVKTRTWQRRRRGPAAEATQEPTPHSMAKERRSAETVDA